MKTYAVILIYDKNKEVIHQDLCCCSKGQAEQKADSDCKWLGGASWEVLTLDVREGK